MLEPTCEVAGCDGKRFARSMCSKHYQRMRLDGTLQTGNRFTNPEDSFASRTKLAANGCIEWTGAIGDNGYGRISAHGKSVKAHRYAWEKANGPIAAGVVIDHICHNRSCVNVSHLRAASNKENASHRRGPNPNSLTGIRNVGSRGGGFQVRITAGGKDNYFGVYPTAEEAKGVADRERKRLFGEFAGAFFMGENDEEDT